MPDLEAQAYHHYREYEAVAAWWRASGVEPLPLEAAPPIGCWAARGDQKLAAAFAYPTAGHVIIMAFPIADPALPRQVQAEALAFAIASLSNDFRTMMPSCVMVSISHDLSVHQAWMKRAGFHGTGKAWLAVSAPAGADLDIFTE